MITLVRLIALIRKELSAVLGDRQSLRLLIVPVILQILVFPRAATLEVKNNVLAVYDEDGGAASGELIQRLSHTPAFTRVERVDSLAEGRALIDQQATLLVLHFPARFSDSVQRGAPDPIQTLMDGRRSNSAQIAASYVQSVLDAAPVGAAPRRPPAITVRNWYNANLDYKNFIVPSLVAMIVTLSVLIVTAMSLAREREQGTLDQLLVSPLTPGMIFLGKAAPALVVATLQGTIILLAGVFGYGIAFQGSLGLLFASMCAYVVALVGVGLMISSVCKTQQQAFLGVFLFMMPAILLSGYVTPVDNMPGWLQVGTWANPVRHFVEIAKGVYLKDAVFADLRGNIVALLAIGVVTISISLAMFHRKLS